MADFDLTGQSLKPADFRIQKDNASEVLSGVHDLMEPTLTSSSLKHNVSFHRSQISFHFFLFFFFHYNHQILCYGPSKKKKEKEKEKKKLSGDFLVYWTMDRPKWKT